MWTKICANTTLEDALMAVEMGADALGFVFARSKRQVTPNQTAQIVARLPKRIETVGVFSTENPNQIKEHAEVTGLSAVQLHGAYRSSVVEYLVEECGVGLKIIQTLPYELSPVDRTDSDARYEASLRVIFGDQRVWAVLLDAAIDGESGGLGVSFKWEEVAKIVNRTRQAFGANAARVILAGGLSVEKVAAAIAIIAPWGVDVVSGVEASPGKKDPAKLKAFLQAAKKTL